MHAKGAPESSGAPFANHLRGEGREDLVSDECADPPVTAFTLYVRVLSETISPDEIGARLGVPADESYAAGSRKHPRAMPRTHNRWVRHARSPEPGARPEDLEQIVTGWGTPFARALGTLVDSGEASVSLVLVQQVHDLDDEMALGIVLSAELVTWLALARADVDMDQYIFHECDESADA
ncbi:DUF4279 domain-containing protein [Streptomyces arboris]|uniref:DUF4279 domain-containing protein n=1 Tax=Streptomyces arboris TaxID=2600619 RepID=UPI003BF60A04